MTNEERENLKEPTFSELVDYLEVLSNGYVKPDLVKGNMPRVQDGIVRDTKKFFDYIDAVNDELCRRAGATVNKSFIERKEIN